MLGCVGRVEGIRFLRREGYLLGVDMRVSQWRCGLIGREGLVGARVSAWVWVGASACAHGDVRCMYLRRCPSKHPRRRRRCPGPRRLVGLLASGYQPVGEGRRDEAWVG